MHIYIGNLHFNVSEEHLRNLFTPFGRVNSVNIIMDMESGQSKGFGFVEMDEAIDGTEAIKQLDNQNCMGQFLQVSPAIARSTKNSRRHQKKMKIIKGRFKESVKALVIVLAIVISHVIYLRVHATFHRCHFQASCWVKRKY